MDFLISSGQHGPKHREVPVPIINIQTLPVPAGVNTEVVMQAVIKGLSSAIGTPEERIFAGWSYYQLQADGLNVKSKFQAASHPPIVSIDLLEGRTKEQKVDALKAVASALKEHLDFDGNPFVHIRDIANAHVMTGGNVIDKSK